MNWDASLAEIKPRLMEVFQHLHTHAEISWEEFETTGFLARELEGLGLRVRVCDGGLGVIGEWGPQGGPVVALRSDIDALWQEVDGDWRANHSCGHDGHMTAVLGAITLLKQQLPSPPTRIRVIFQPAEEKGNGALFMTNQGAVDDVRFLFGIHLRPIQELVNGQMSAAIYNGAATTVEGTITGCAAHGARPHLGVNAIEVAFQVMQAVSLIHMNPMIPHSVKMTRIQAGGKSANIIPDTAEFAFDLRAQTNEAIVELIERTEERIQHVCDMVGANVELKRGGRTVAAKVGAEAQRILAEAIVNCRGPEALAADVVTPGAEDFHFYTAERPGLQATMLGLGCDLAPGLHHPHMTFRREALGDAMVVLAEAVARASLMASQTVVNGAQSE